jgi:hypothetical protein
VKLPIGDHDLTVVVRDDDGALGIDTMRVSVVETPPSITCPANQVLECTNGGAVATYSPTVVGGCGNVTTSCVPPSGTTFANDTTSHPTCTAVDELNQTASCSFDVTVHDTAGPVVTTTLGGTYWPPSHGYRSFSLHDCVTSVVDACHGALSVDAAGKIVRITSDEVEDGPADGATCNDIVITGNTTANLRAEREGNGDGRVYTVHFTVGDSDGNQTAATCQIHVSHDLPAGPAVDSGPAYCEGTGCGPIPSHSPSCVH